ncbi:MAG: hypothetical protein C4523_20700, partial [Myxococcales bacterium]
MFGAVQDKEKGGRGRLSRWFSRRRAALAAGDPLSAAAGRLGSALQALAYVLAFAYLAAMVYAMARRLL